MPWRMYDGEGVAISPMSSGPLNTDSYPWRAGRSSARGGEGDLKGGIFVELSPNGADLVIEDTR